MTPCSRCHREARLPGQSWGKMCFAAYRRQERARRRAAREEEQRPSPDRAPEAALSGRDGQATLLPSLSIRLRACPLTIRFPGGHIHSEDAEVLKRLPVGVHYGALVWVGHDQEGRNR